MWAVVAVSALEVKLVRGRGRYDVGQTRLQVAQVVGGLVLVARGVDHQRAQSCPSVGAGVLQSLEFSSAHRDVIAGRFGSPGVVDHGRALVHGMRERPKHHCVGEKDGSFDQPDRDDVAVRTDAHHALAVGGAGGH
jgi:hypothetical protein